MAIAKQKKRNVQCTLPVEVDNSLNDIIHEARNKLGQTITKSQIITSALLMYFEAAKKINDKNVSNNKEEN